MTLRRCDAALTFILMMVFAPACAAADAFSVAALELAVERGDVRAMTQLAARYELGDGVAKSFLKANYLYCRAAHGDYAEAQFMLAGIYANGRAVARDHAVAAGLYARAAAQGHEHAKRLLHYLQAQLKVSINAELPACIRPEDPLGLRLSHDLSQGGARSPAVETGR